MRRVLPVAAVLLGLLLLPPLQRGVGFPEYYLVFLYFLFFWVTQTTSWNLLSGYAGYFSFGQAALLGSGVYTSAVLIARHGAPVPLAVLAGGLAACGVASFIGLVTFRLRRMSGPIFALVTLAVTMGLHTLVNNVQYLDGGRGIPLPKLTWGGWIRSDLEAIYYGGLGITAFTVFLAYAVYQGRLGWGLRGIHDDEEAAEGVGVPTFGYKMAALALSGALAGLSGGLHALHMRYVTSDAVFSLRVPMLVIVMAILGGRNHWAGPVLGAAIVHTLNDRLSGAGWSAVSEVVLGVLMMGVVAAFPRGVYGRLCERDGRRVAGWSAAAAALYGLATRSSVLDSLLVGWLVLLGLLMVPARWPLFGWRPGLLRSRTVREVVDKG